MNDPVEPGPLSRGFLDYFDWVYAKWDDEWDRFGDRPSFAGLRVLDFGSGHGSFAVRAAQEGASVVGLDVNDDVVLEATQHCRERFADLDLSFTSCPVDALEDTFDVIITHETFEHVLDLPACLVTLNRRLMPGGRLYASWGPLWSSPLGGHELTAHFGQVPVPYSHLAQGPALRHYRARHPASDARSIADVGLNGLSYRDYRRIVAESPFEVLRWQANAGGHPLYRALRLAARVTPRLATANVYAILRRPPAPV